MVGGVGGGYMPRKAMTRERGLCSIGLENHSGKMENAIFPRCVHAKSLQVCSTMYNPMNCFPVHGISQARILEWLPCPLPGDLPDPGIEPSLLSPGLAGAFFTTSATWEACHLSSLTP